MVLRVVGVMVAVLAVPDRRATVRAGQILGGIEEVRQNWDLLLRSLPDFRAEVVRVAADGDAAFIEQDWSGTRLDGTKMHSRGVNVFGIREGQITWGRVYMETVEKNGIDLDERVRRMAEGTSAGGFTG